MRITAKFGVTAADALRLAREATKVHVFVGEGEDCFILEMSKASAIRDLRRIPAHRGRRCHLDVDGRTLYFGSFRASLHARRVRELNERRAAAMVAQ
ncbi:hypothetical protein [Bradyrhizobium liaoningense]|uniref:hypothetical protein n=1 Tax=Bradyrhizobium liaoningense TaxID=43992 RepID=UPI001BA460BB|nr:hypothetical protein [Bradyrhizobium liaoningense]MBR0855450.1 hypothetical protein [Bradyrhizobium liaoningense]